MKIFGLFSIMFKLAIPVTNVLVKDKKQEVPEKCSNPESSIVGQLSSPESRHKNEKPHTEGNGRKNHASFVIK